ncbi:MAG TPA: enoyl-CoA hydratase [Blastocatellia bacterium]|nr:enoyl-CoA hydratase [Blastocatellia bacterium]
MAGYEYLQVESNEKIVRVTLNRPEKRNALSLALMRELTNCLRENGAAKDTQVIILAANGTVFSAGHDLSEMTGRSANDYRELFDACVELMQTLHRIPQPVIAEVQGIATAAGCQLVAACDLAVASEKAKFATPGVKIGLFCSTPMVELTRAIGRKRALEMLLTGAMIDAHKAAEWGLVNRVVSAESLREETSALANQIAEASSMTISIGKQAFYAQIDLDHAKAYDYTKEVMSLNAMAEDAQEGISAFLEKRQPCWKGR